MQFQNIPEELKAISQWCVWRYEDIGSLKPTKVPYDPKSINVHANVNDPRTFGSFDETVKRYNIGGFDGIGFIFTEGDSYSFIDLDDPANLPNGNPNPNYQIDLERQIKIFREFDSYAEVSPGGKGLHVIVKGKIPVGRKRSFIEIYSTGRYATFTGNVYHDKPVEYRQDILTQLWEQMGNAPNTYTFTGNDKEIYNDQQVIDKALNASNGDKFKALLEGNWQNIYPSQSEADFAFVDIVAFYTQNKKQIERLFRASPLGKRDKAKRSDYVDWMIGKSFDRQLPPIDFDGFKNALDLKLAQSKASPQLSLPMDMPTEIRSSIVIPPGLLGELSQFIYQAAPRPIPEIALAGAIGLMAGICGRAYNVSGTGLNQYIILIANTGSGKEGIASGIDKIMGSIKAQVPTSTRFRGPAEFASGQALLKYLNKKSNCFFSILGEFGLRLAELSNPLAQNVEKKTKRILLDLYNKSGHTQTFQGNIYADMNENVEVTYSPAVSIIGESTPEKFYDVLNEDMIAEGLLPRFIIIEYKGTVPYLNYEHVNVFPPFTLIEKFASLVANCETIMHANKVINIQFNEAADKISKEFEKHCTDEINKSGVEVRRQLWNRAHLKSIRLAGLIAVGTNMSYPVIVPEFMNYAINMVQSDIKAISAKFESGEVGQSFENKQISITLSYLRAFFTMGADKAKSYGVGQVMYDGRVIPYGYLSRRLLAAACFKQDKVGATNAVKRTIQTLLDSDKIREVSRHDMVHRFGSTQRAFMISDLDILS